MLLNLHVYGQATTAFNVVGKPKVVLCSTFNFDRSLLSETTPDTLVSED